jgi:hypothetical protein
VERGVERQEAFLSLKDVEKERAFSEKSMKFNLLLSPHAEAFSVRTYYDLLSEGNNIVCGEELDEYPGKCNKLKRCDTSSVFNISSQTRSI